MEPFTGSIPTYGDINVYDSLDERTACGHFLGKNLTEAEALFRENANVYMEDLLFMGPKAFHYYVHAAINYLVSEFASGDPDAVNSFAGILEHKKRLQKEELEPVAKQLSYACSFIFEHWDRFEVSNHYGNLKNDYQTLQLYLAQLAEGSH